MTYHDWDFWVRTELKVSILNKPMQNDVPFPAWERKNYQKLKTGPSTSYVYLRANARDNHDSTTDQI